MPDKIVDGFEHQTGHHCGSVAMADLLRHVGHDFSEPMVFGLGAGLGFYYFKSDHVSPTRQIMGRHFNLEENVAEALGLELRASRTKDEDEAWEHVRTAIDDDQPVLVQCDLSHLPYWQTSTPFNGHRIVVAGYNAGEDVALVADTHFEGLQRVPLEALRDARASQAPPSMGNQNVSWVLEPGEVTPLAEATMQALEQNRVQMEDDASGMGGIDVLRTFADEVVGWAARDDAAWCYKFGYQVIEKRGTGGGFFRYLYRDFLRELVELHPELAAMQLPTSMTRTADAWSTLARYMEAMSRQVDPDAESPDHDAAHHLESMAEATYQFETTFWDRLAMI
ncbi:MAG: BtrH N-terminal domain-containing protein [Myxococcota bacterium]